MSGGSVAASLEDAATSVPYEYAADRYLMEIAIGTGLFFILAMFLWILWQNYTLKVTIEGMVSMAELQKLLAEKSTVSLTPEQSKLFRELPQKVLETLQGSANTTAGKLGEITKFIQLRSAYDRLIPLGDIADFLGIQFPTDTNEGAVHFIDVKAGKRAALSVDQRKLKKLVTEHPEMVKFVTVKTEIIADGTD